MIPKQMRPPIAAYPIVFIAGSVVVMAAYCSARALVSGPGIYFTSDELSERYTEKLNAANSRQYSMFRSLARLAHRND
jgi:hypothetical protein